MINNNLSDIRAFVVIAREGSFSKAAKVTHVTAPHITRQLQRLEHSMGVQLIKRTTRSVVLTAEGQDFFEKCQGALTQIDEAVLSALDTNKALSGKIKINSVGGIIGEDIIAKCLSNFAREYPDIELEIDFSSERVDLIANNYDVVVRMGELDDSGLYAKKVSEVEISLYASPAYIEKYGLVQHPHELREHKCLTGSVSKWSFRNAANGEQETVDIKSHMTCKSGRALRRFAENGLGIARLPKQYCEPLVEEGHLIEAIDQWHIEAIPLYLVYYNPENQPLRVSSLIEYLQNNLYN